MTQLNNPDAPLFQLPAEVYVGRNVVRRHIVDFFCQSDAVTYLAQGEEILAIFDGIILNLQARRFTTRSLHDYAILTNQNLLLWSRGDRQTVVHRHPWNSLTLKKYGRRSELEGTLLLSFSPPAPANRRRITIRSGSGSSAQAQELPLPAVAETLYYLDLMPLLEVRLCARMLRHLMTAPGEQASESFRQAFHSELEASKVNLTRVAELLRPFYTRQPNGVYIEVSAGEERYSVRMLADYIRQLTFSQWAGEASNPENGTSNYSRPYERGLTLPVLAALSKDVINEYSLSRILRGAWLDTDSILDRLEVFGEATEGIADMVEVLATDPETRQNLKARLREVINSQSKSRSPFLNATYRAFFEPVLERVLPETTTPEHRAIRVRPRE
ncbi:MAG TPA: hypothetical protein VH186_24270 [Chloroflexia bacterium]|nr:hypothetical protein [Chloroflexia bacterium]